SDRRSTSIGADRVDLGHAILLLIALRPSGLAITRPFTIEPKTDETGQRSEPEARVSAFWDQQPLDPVKPNTRIAGSVIELDVRDAFLQRIRSRHDILHSVVSETNMDAVAPHTAPWFRASVRGFTPERIFFEHPRLRRSRVFSTRAISLIAAARSGKNCSPCWHSTTSKLSA